MEIETKNFVEINAVEKHRTRTYRFYGLGVWKIKDGDGWHTINGINVPARVLEVAATQCHPEPPRHPALLTEVEIARMCGGQM